MNSFFNCQTDEFETSTQDFTTQNFGKSVFIQLLFLCDGCMRIHAVVKPASKVNRYFFSAGGRSFLDESHLGSFACLGLILVEALLSVALKCT